MRKTYNYSKLSIRNTDLYYQVAGEGGEVWYQGRGVFEILDMDWNCRLVERISKKNKRTMNCEWVRLRPISWFLNVAGIKEALEGRYSEYLSKDGQTGYALLQSFVRMQRKPQPEQQALPMPLPTLEAEPAPEPVRMEPEPEPDPEPVNTEANLAGLNVTPDAMARKMSSREIAELTGKRHKNVIQDIEGVYMSYVINYIKHKKYTKKI